VDALEVGGSAAGGSAAGGSAAFEVLGVAVVFAIVLVSTPGAVRTSILLVVVELNLVGAAWE
jgi:hypothetical protein